MQSFEELIADQGEVAIIIEFDSASEDCIVSAYAHLQYNFPSVPSSARLSRLYLSMCDSISTFSLSDFPTYIGPSVFISEESVQQAFGNRTTYKEQPMIVTPKGVVTKKKYKPVAKKVKSVIAPLPSQFRIERNIIGDPITDIPSLSPTPPTFTPTGRCMQVHMEAFVQRHGDFLNPEELKLAHQLMCLQNEGFAWSDTERSSFKAEFFPPIKIPVIPHTPWIERNISIPPGIYDQVCAIIQKKIEAGVLRGF